MAGDKKGAQEQGATIIFVDESGFYLTPNVRRTWSKRGVTPIIRHWLAKDKLNAICAIEYNPDNDDTNVLFYMQKENVNSDIIIKFIDALHKEVPGRIVLLWDRYSPHKSKIVKEHIKNQSDWLTTEPFPAYAPELNPVEYMLSALKTKDVAGLCAAHIAQIADKLELAVDRLADNQNIILGFIKAAGLYVT